MLRGQRCTINCVECSRQGKLNVNGVVKFYVLILKIAMGLALAGTLKEATLAMAHRAAHAQKYEMMSYGKFTRMLTGSRVNINCSR